LLAGCNILIATDVAQRGLDIKDVAYVVNYVSDFARQNTPCLLLLFLPACIP
jgi:hypothetical protein